MEADEQLGALGELGAVAIAVAIVVIVIAEGTVSKSGGVFYCVVVGVKMRWQPVVVTVAVDVAAQLL